MINENLLKYRRKIGKTHQDIADLLEIDRRTYINWENGTNCIKSEFIPKLAEIFGVGIEKLFENSREMKLKITQTHNEGKDNSFLNGAIIVLTDKASVEEIVNLVKDKMKIDI